MQSPWGIEGFFLMCDGRVFIGGFRASGLGFGVWGLELYGLGFRGQALGLGGLRG